MVVSKKHFLFLLCAVFLTCLGFDGMCADAFQPDGGGRKLSGKVLDENGEPLPGVAVYDAARMKDGVLTDDRGKFVIYVSSSCRELTVSCLGYQTETVPLKEASEIRLVPDTQTIEETVVTGIFTRKRESFTGAVQAITSSELKKVGNANIIESLKNLDPSLLVVDNLSQGSNPNSVASMQIRGASSLNAETSSLKSDFVADGNSPLFILDGFETTLTKIKDMDMNRIQSISILKDASAKAIYGSKGANGVIVIETKALTNERTLVTYTGSVTFEVPDLSSYNLCNALEKLDIENREGYYSSNSSLSEISARKLYNERLKKALEGEDTYWLSKPLRTGIGQKHFVSVEMGGKALKALAAFSYNNVQGAMKGSYRNVVSGDVNLSYRKNKWTFRNIMSIVWNKSEDSPYGSFDLYASMNPYYSPYDAEGNIRKILYSGTYGEGTSAFSTGTVVNPMWNATIGTKYTSGYLDFTDNFYVEYQMLKALKLVARFGIDTKRTESEEFRPADHTDFVNYTTEDAKLRRGTYDMANGSYTTFSGDVSAQFNHSFNKVHDVFATAQYNISQTSYNEVQHFTEGFPNSNMSSITFARQYALDRTPSGGDGLNRNLGALLTAGYSYDNRYMTDATIKGSASSVFGTNNKWGAFWSFGLAWNIHNEKFMKNASAWLQQFKLRASVGSSGNQNYTTNVSLPVYTYYSSSYYNGFTGAYLSNMENPFLGWERKMDYNVGIDFRTRRINAVLDLYIADTNNLVFSRTILPSTGFNYVNDNLGQVRNRGVELSLSYILFQKRSSFISVFGKLAYNDNRVLKISDALEAYNRRQRAEANSSSGASTVIQYYNGMPLHSIWAVPSKGIDPITGNEIFVKKDGTLTDIWSASDLVNCGSSDPKFNGNFGLTGELKGFGFNVVFTWYGGGYLYNSTLLDKVEGTDLSTNVDRRIFSGRWYYKGQNAVYKKAFSNTAEGNVTTTKATTRFVQHNDVMNLSSVSAYYELPSRFADKIKMDRLRLTFYVNDLFTWSSIDIERGTSYPFARSFSFSLTATF